MMALILPKWPNSIPHVIQQNVVVNCVIDKLVFTAAERVLHGPVKSQFGFHLVEIKFRMDF
jgi:hypothetical protein